MAFDPTKEAPQPQITNADLARRKELLELTAQCEATLAGYQPLVRAEVDEIVRTFYEHQTKVPEIQNLIRDEASLARLKNAMRHYVVDLFGGVYGPDYANGRTKIGQVHARIGVSPWLYIASMRKLESVICSTLHQNGAPPLHCVALGKLMKLDLQLVLDTYIDSLMGQVSQANDKLRLHAEQLESEVAARTAELAQAAMTDPLTGLGNRRALIEKLKAEMLAAQTVGVPLSVAFFDLDGLKVINDSKGHIHGDRHLAKAGETMLQAFGGLGHAFRYGGDEFCVVLEKCSAAQAEGLCAAYCRSVEPEISLSFGVAEFDPDTAESVTDLIARADGAMYASRRIERSARSVAQIRA